MIEGSQGGHVTPSIPQRIRQLYDGDICVCVQRDLDAGKSSRSDCYSGIFYAESFANQIAKGTARGRGYGFYFRKNRVLRGSLVCHVGSCDSSRYDVAVGAFSSRAI